MADHTTTAQDAIVTATDITNLERIDDPEMIHAAADARLLASVHPEIRDAYLHLMDRCPWWVTA